MVCHVNYVVIYGHQIKIRAGSVTVRTDTLRLLAAKPDFKPGFKRGFIMKFNVNFKNHDT